MKKCSINSFLSLGANDGPSIRSVVFTQGCPLRCIYCHNPETWEFKENNTNVDELVDKILKYKPFYKQNGGVTVSGGEPLCQDEFLIYLFKKLKENQIHTCLDTSGCVDFNEEILNYTDLILCDLKFITEEEYTKYTGGSFKKVLNFLDIANKYNIKVWLRHVLVPNITDNEEYVNKIVSFSKKYSNIEKIELLPFKNICQSKYDNLGIDFKMKDTALTNANKIAKLNEIILLN